MSEALSNRRAVVTGASKGIGFAIAQALLTAGADVIICGRDPKQVKAAVSRLSKTAPDRKVAGHATDVSSSEQVAGLFRFVDEQFGGLDILINNAGFGIFRAAAELSIQEWDRLIGTNLSGAFYCSREALERFKQSRGGWIINISSLAGKNPFAGGAGYNASKFGLNGFTEAMMMDHRYDNVRVSYIMPGSVDTEFAGEQASKRSDWKIAPEDIAEIVLGILKMPERTLISRVEVRPSRPQKN
ncbi:MAG TPA: SDR family oxidoreductase [Bryobacteraceae bacterium]|jgi:NAD(P)-dependent dehydrogenase (short-subunit alcohol dehydrogenase family)|nr:SDR family oxidoreductase [Bryobacteraceae bacterium]